MESNRTNSYDCRNVSCVNSYLSPLVISCCEAGFFRKNFVQNFREGRAPREGSTGRETIRFLHYTNSAS